MCRRTPGRSGPATELDFHEPSFHGTFRAIRDAALVPHGSAASSTNRIGRTTSIVLVKKSSCLDGEFGESVPHEQPPKCPSPAQLAQDMMNVVTHVPRPPAGVPAWRLGPRINCLSGSCTTAF